MTNTIPNVPRELLAELQEHIHCHHDAVLWGKVYDLLYAPSPANHVEDVRAMVAAPSPAGVDGLEVVAYRVSLPGEPELGTWLDEDAENEPQMCLHEPLCRLSDAQAIIDGLRGELQQSYQQVNSECMDWAKEYERRKGVQAERDTLKSMLREFAVGISKREMPTEQELNSWFDRIDAALSAGKEGE